MPCLDIKDGKIVKGVHFVNLIDAGDPISAAQAYEKDGADEIAFLDITATVENRKTTLSLVRNISKLICIPLTVGGGIDSLTTAAHVVEAGATRISVSSKAVRNPRLINSLAEELGPEKTVVAIDVDFSKITPSGYEVYIDGGRTPTGIDAIKWCEEAEKRGAGILLPTSKACDGVKKGYDLALIKQIKKAVDIPVVASGGAGERDHFLQAANAGADYLLAASVFHFGKIKISELKDYLAANGVNTL